MSRVTTTMRIGAAAATAAALALPAVMLSAAVSAAVPVEESVPSVSNEAPAGQAPAGQTPRGVNVGAAGGDTGRLTELFYQLQVMQQEVQELRGLVEQQGHRLERLERDQQEQYLDLDRRMQALRSGGGARAGGARAGDDDSGRSDGGSSSAGGAGAGGGSATGGGSEREAYTAAFDLMKERQFDESAQAFEAMIRDYPNGAYTPNAFYWLGELHLAQDENEQARQAFAQVVNLYPDHQKVPDALYKLGVAYHRLGDLERAREYLTRVRSEHPQSSAAGLAQTYLSEL